MTNNLRSRNLGFTVIESLVAVSLMSVVIGLFSQGMATTRSSGRVEAKVQALRDARQTFLKLVYEVQRGKSVASPAAWSGAPALEIYNERHEKIRYFLRDGKNGSKELMRANGKDAKGEGRMIASGLDGVSFYRGGDGLVTISMKFTPASDDKRPKEFSTALALRNSVF